MNNTNTLVSGDNKGAAAQFTEHWARTGAGRQAQPDQAAGSSSGSSRNGSSSSGEGASRNGSGVSPGLVAAFCQANVGDTSPNTLGAFCLDTGLPCDAVHSTCNGRVQQCIGRGPGWPDQFESTRLIGQRQADAVQALLLGGERRPRTGGERWGKVGQRCPSSAQGEGGPNSYVKVMSDNLASVGSKIRAPGTACRPWPVPVCALLPGWCRLAAFDHLTHVPKPGSPFSTQIWSLSMAPYSTATRSWTCGGCRWRRPTSHVPAGRASPPWALPLRRAPPMVRGGLGGLFIVEGPG